MEGITFSGGAASYVKYYLVARRMKIDRHPEENRPDNTLFLARLGTHEPKSSIEIIVNYFIAYFILKTTFSFLYTHNNQPMM